MLCKSSVLASQQGSADRAHVPAHHELRLESACRRRADSSAADWTRFPEETAFPLLNEPVGSGHWGRAVTKPAIGAGPLTRPTGRQAERTENWVPIGECAIVVDWAIADDLEETDVRGDQTLGSAQPGAAGCNSS